MRRLYFNMYVISHELMFMDGSWERRTTAPVALTFWQVILAIDIDQIAQLFGINLLPARPRLSGGLAFAAIVLNTWLFLAKDRGEKYYTEFCDGSPQSKRSIHVWGYSIFVVSVVLFISLISYRY
jgi:hypothetical protein